MGRKLPGLDSMLIDRRMSEKYWISTVLKGPKMPLTASFSFPPLCPTRAIIPAGIGAERTLFAQFLLFTLSTAR